MHPACKKNRRDGVCVSVGTVKGLLPRNLQNASMAKVSGSRLPRRYRRRGRFTVDSSDPALGAWNCRYDPFSLASPLSLLRITPKSKPALSAASNKPEMVSASKLMIFSCLA